MAEAGDRRRGEELPRRISAPPPTTADSANVAFDPALFLTIATAIEENTHICSVESVYLA